MATNTPNRKLGPRVEGCHEIGENFNGYGNLTSAQLLHGTDQQGNFLVPSHHIFGGIFLKIKEEYDHNEITAAVNAKRTAEGVAPIDKRSCTRRLAAAIIGRERVAADVEERETDFLKAQLDYDTAHGKDPSIAKAARTQKQHERSNNAQYGNRTTSAGKPKRKLSQSVSQDDSNSDEVEELRPKKVARRPKRKPSHAGDSTPPEMQENQVHPPGQYAHAPTMQMQYQTYPPDPGMLISENDTQGHPPYPGIAHRDSCGAVPTIWEQYPQAPPAFVESAPFLNESTEDHVAELVRSAVMGEQHARMSNE